MSPLRAYAIDRARQYAKTKSFTIETEFGSGCDGFVLATNQGTAIKAFHFPELYRRELEIYEYLLKWDITEVHGFHIPKLLGHDADLAIIEMTVVSPPFVLDFVSARIEIPVEYDEEWIARRMDEFEEDWSTVKRVIWGFEQHGIYLSDVHPRNIKCR
jgi:hypothetical protein